MAFRSALLLLAAALTLTACVSAPPLAADPDTAAYLAQGTLQAASTLQARAAQEATGTMSAILAVHESTRAAVAAQQTAVAEATRQAASATQAAVTAGQETRAAEVALVAAATAEAGGTRAAGLAQLTRDAGWEATRRTALQAVATAERLQLDAQQDRAAARRANVWGWLGLLFAAGLAGCGLLLLYSIAARRLADSRIIRNERTGVPVALWVGRGLWEPLAEPVLPAALPPPPAEEEEAGLQPHVIRVNGARRETIYQYDDDTPLHWRDMHIALSQQQLRTMRDWYERGHTRVRRDTSSAGPGLDQLGLGSGSTYNTLRAILAGLEYIDASGEWTPRGLVELLDAAPPAPSIPSSASSSRLRRRRTEPH